MAMKWSPVNAGNLEFWAVEVKRNVRVSPLKDKVIHLTQASLGMANRKKGNGVKQAEGKGKQAVAHSNEEKGSATLFVDVDGKKQIVIATLIPQLLPQQQFDLVFEEGFMLSHNWEGSVFFCGYTADRPSNKFPLTHDGKEDTVRAVYGKSEPKAKRSMLLEEPGTKGKHRREIAETSKAAYPEGDSESSKKRAFESGIRTHGKDKKAKVTTQEADGKQAGNTLATEPNQSPQSGKFDCNSCKGKFGTKKALVSHQTAKHSSQM